MTVMARKTTETEERRGYWTCRKTLYCQAGQKTPDARQAMSVRMRRTSAYAAMRGNKPNAADGGFSPARRHSDGSRGYYSRRVFFNSLGIGEGV